MQGHKILRQGLELKASEEDGHPTFSFGPPRKDQLDSINSLQQFRPWWDSQQQEYVCAQSEGHLAVLALFHREAVIAH